MFTELNSGCTGERTECQNVSCSKKRNGCLSELLAMTKPLLDINSAKLGYGFSRKFACSRSQEITKSRVRKPPGTALGTDPGTYGNHCLSRFVDLGVSKAGAAYLRALPRLQAGLGRAKVSGRQAPVFPLRAARWKVEPNH